MRQENTKILLEMVKNDTVTESINQEQLESLISYLNECNIINYADEEALANLEPGGRITHLIGIVISSTNDENMKKFLTSLKRAGCSVAVNWLENKLSINRRKKIGYTLPALIVIILLLSVVIWKSTSNDDMLLVDKDGETEVFFSYIGKLTKSYSDCEMFQDTSNEIMLLSNNNGETESTSNNEAPLINKDGEAEDTSNEVTPLANNDGETENTSNDVPPLVNSDRETEVFFSYKGKPTKSCLIKNDKLEVSDSCIVEEQCSLIESINGNWIIDNDEGNIEVKNKKITFMKNFRGSIHFEFIVYHSLEQVHGFHVYLNGHILLKCIWSDAVIQAADNTKQCDSVGPNQPYLLMNKVMWNSTLIDYETGLELYKGDNIMVDFINHGILCRRPKIVIKEEFITSYSME